MTVSSATEPAALLERVSLDLGARRVLDDLSLAVPRGTLTAIVGPNGCGKSTIARMLCGFLYPTKGLVRVLGNRLGEVNVHALRERVKLVQPNVVHEPDPRLSVREVVLTGAFGTIDLHDEPSAEQKARAVALIEQLRLQAVADGSFRTCSSGERMRTQLARSLMTRPELLLLDEPTAGLDLPMREQLLATLDAILTSEEPPTILLVTHHLEELPLATSQVVLMSAGRVEAAGRPGDVLTSAAMTRAFAFPIEVTANGGRYTARAALAATSRLG